MDTWKSVPGARIENQIPVMDDSGKLIALVQTVLTPHGFDCDAQAANANLIAGAPSLYCACALAAGVFDSWADLSPDPVYARHVRDICHAALAKTRGE